MRIVLLGTGTDVGKTYVGVALARELQRLAPSRRVFALKPVESGVVRGVAVDARALEAAAPGTGYPSPHPLYAFEPPVSPHLAARRANVSIHLERIAAWLRDAEAEAPADSIYIVETAGGVFSPLSAALTNLDLARALEPAIWVLVVPDALGALHDSRAALIAMTQAARAPDHVIVNAARPPDAATGSTSHELAVLGLAQPAATLSRGDMRAVAPLAALLLK
ncbi:MAG TPA: dethiobiotin synthase [Polyangiaceae bacterium]